MLKVIKWIILIEYTKINIHREMQ